MPTEFTLSQAAVERSTFAVTVAFTDENGDPVTPTSLTWSLVKENRATIVNSRSNVTVNTPGTSAVIVLSGADLALDDGKGLTWLYLVIEGLYNSTLGNDLPLKDHLKFPVVDVAKVPN